MWFAKLKAFSIHFLGTALLAGLAALMVFKLWYPYPFADMMGGMNLFLLVVVCDLALGPLMSLVIYNPKKSRKELFTDYAVILALQFAALAYGLHTVSQARPAFLVFTVDRYVVVSSGELPGSELQRASKAEWRKASAWGYHTTFVQPPRDASSQYELVMSALNGGRDLQHLVENYQPVAEHVAAIMRVAKPLEALRSSFPERAQSIDDAVAQSTRPAKDLRWLPVQAGSVFWTALIDVQTALPLAWVNLDPL